MHVVGPVPPHVHTITGGTIHVLPHPIKANRGQVFIDGLWREVQDNETITVRAGMPHGFKVADGDDFWVISVDSPKLDPTDRVEHTGYTN